MYNSPPLCNSSRANNPPNVADSPGKTVPAEPQRTIVADDMTWEAQSAHSWPRRPEPWSRARINDLFLQMADLQKTALGCPAMAEELQKRLAALQGIGIEALVERLVPGTIRQMVMDEAREEVARQIALQLPPAIEVGVETEIAMREDL